jgi:hypothetical protein
MLAGRAGYCLMVFGVVRSIFGYKALNANAVFGQRNRKGGMSLRSMLGKRTKGECRGHRADSTTRFQLARSSSRRSSSVSFSLTILCT